MDKVLERIINVMKQKGVTQKEIVEMLGLNQAAFTDWKAGKSHSYKKHIPKIAEYLGVSEDEILFDTLPATKRYVLPVYGMVSCGNGCTAIDEILDYEVADMEYDLEQYFWLRAEGDSMYPKIIEGDLVLVKRQNSVDVGDTAVVLVDGEQGFLKKVFYTEDKIELHSSNPFYKPIVFEGAEVLRVHVIGKVMELKRKF